MLTGTCFPSCQPWEQGPGGTLPGLLRMQSSTFPSPPLSPAKGWSDVLYHSIWTFFLPSQGCPFAHTHLSTPYLLLSFLAPTAALGSPPRATWGCCGVPATPPCLHCHNRVIWWLVLGGQAPIQRPLYSQPSHADTWMWMKGSVTFPTVDLIWGRTSGKTGLHTCLLMPNPLATFPNLPSLFPSVGYREKGLLDAAHFSFKSFISYTSKVPT